MTEIEQWSSLYVFILACAASGLGAVGALYKPGASVSLNVVIGTFMFNAMLGGGLALWIYDLPYIGKAKAIGAAALTGVGVVKISRITRIVDGVLPPNGQ